MLAQDRGVSAVLRHARKARGVSQEELSKQLGLRQGTVSRAETSNDIRFTTLQQLARALDLEPMLIPRRLVPVVDAIVRHGMIDAHPFDPDNDKPYDEAYDDFEQPLGPTLDT